MKFKLITILLSSSIVTMAAPKVTMDTKVTENDLLKIVNRKKPEHLEKKEIKLVEQFDTANGTKVEFLTPFKPKAIGIVPQRWKIEEINGALVTNDNIKLDNGNVTKLKVNVYRIVPNTSLGINRVIEPGFDPRQGIAQTNTIGSIMTKYIIECQKIENAMEVSLNDYEDIILKKLTKKKLIKK